MMTYATITDEDVRRAVAIARTLPRDARLHRLGYDQAVVEVATAFNAAIDFARRAGSLRAAVLGLRAWPRNEGRDWERWRLIQAAVEAIAGIDDPHDAFFPVERMRVADVGRLIVELGLVKQAYVADMPDWRFQNYPFRGGWDRYACRRVHYKMLPPEDRGEVPEPPPGWTVEEHFLHDREWVTVIRQTDPGASLPEGWHEIDFGEGEVT